MKKLFLLSALALSAMTMSAQLQLLHTFDQDIKEPWSYAFSQNAALPALQYYTGMDTTSTSITIRFFSATTFQKVSEITVPRQSTHNKLHGYEVIAYNYFWNNSSSLYFMVNEMWEGDEKCSLYNESGQLVQTFEEGSACIVPSADGWQFLVIPRGGFAKVYSIPGNGQPTDLEAPTAPARTSNARKVVENGQMYIILDGVKYAVTGSTTM